MEYNDIKQKKQYWAIVQGRRNAQSQLVGRYNDVLSTVRQLCAGPKYCHCRHSHIRD